MRVAMLREQGQGGIGQWAIFQSTARTLGVEVKPIDLWREAALIERDIAAYAHVPNSGMVIAVSAASLLHSKLIVSLAAPLLVRPLASPERLRASAATKQEVSENLGSRFIGKNVDTIISEFGPPASAFRMNSGETAYVWQLSAVTDINMDRYGGTAKTYPCKVNVISSANGTVTKLTTEDSSGTGGVVGLFVDVHGSICARHLGMPRRTTALDRPDVRYWG